MRFPQVFALVLSLLLVPGPGAAAGGPGALKRAFDKLREALSLPDRRPEPPRFQPFSFAVLTDLHIGEGIPDFGTPGYEDEHQGIPADDLRIHRVAVAVDKVSGLSEDIRFVLVAGDLTNSAERSEFQVAKLLLDRLEVPYIPLIGNHDMRPYCKGMEAPDMRGKKYFDEVFGDYVEDLPKSIASLVIPATPDFVNFSFAYRGVGFLALDWNSRRPNRFGPGASPGGLLHDFPGGTFQWLDTLLKGGWHHDKSQVFLLQHHPFRAKMPREVAGCFSRADTETLKNFLRKHFPGSKLAAVIAGHQHRGYEGPAFDGWTELRQVETDSAKESSAVTVVTVDSPSTYSIHRR